MKTIFEQLTGRDYEPIRKYTHYMIRQNFIDAFADSIIVKLYKTKIKEAKT